MYFVSRAAADTYKYIALPDAGETPSADLVFSFSILP